MSLGEARYAVNHTTNNMTPPTEGAPDRDLLPGVGAMVGIDGNAFAIMAWAERQMKRAGASREYIKAYTDEAMSDDYDHLLAATVAYATNELDDNEPPWSDAVLADKAGGPSDPDEAREDDDEGFTFGDAMALR